MKRPIRPLLVYLMSKKPRLVRVSTPDLKPLFCIRDLSSCCYLISLWDTEIVKSIALQSTMFLQRREKMFGWVE